MLLHYLLLSRSWYFVLSSWNLLTWVVIQTLRFQFYFGLEKIWERVNKTSLLKKITLELLGRPSSPCWFKETCNEPYNHFRKFPWSKVTKKHKDKTYQGPSPFYSWQRTQNFFYFFRQKVGIQRRRAWLKSSAQVKHW